MTAPRDEFFMRMALKLAKKGEGWTSPNPMVGAVIVRKGRVIGQGHHEKFGGKHAEINAIESAPGALEGATIYITLEPCAHHGKTPPCLHRLLDAGLSRVVIGSIDPNPRVSGRSVRILRRRGVEVTSGVLEKECRELNEPFFKFMNTGHPFVTLKYAQTIDGRIAASSGASKWISSAASLKFAHRLRATHDRILVGIGTVLTDDPQLTCRRVKGRSPGRVIVDSRLQISPSAKVLQDQDKVKTVIFTTPRCDRQKLRALAGMGVDVRITDADDEGRVDLGRVLLELGRDGVTSVLVEGGGRMITSFLKRNLVDRLLIVTAPKILGTGIEAVGDLGIDELKNSVRLTVRKVARKGEDIVVDARVEVGSPSGKRIRR